MTAGGRERSPEWFIPAGPHRNIPGRREYSPAPSGLFAAGGNIPNRALGYPQPAGIFPAFGGGTPGWRGGIPGNVGGFTPRTPSLSEGRGPSPKDCTRRWLRRAEGSTQVMWAKGR